MGCGIFLGLTQNDNYKPKSLYYFVLRYTNRVSIKHVKNWMGQMLFNGLLQTNQISYGNRHFCIV